MKFKYLDGLRGLAALVVVIDHFAIAFFQRSTDASIPLRHTWFEEVILQTPLHLLVSGNFAVCIFFVLSGFVLSTKFFKTGDRRVVVGSAVRRYLRLEIPVLVSVIISFLLLSFALFYNDAAAAITGSTWLRDLWHITPSFWDALYHATIGIFVEGKSSFNTVLWTMQMELWGSFLVFILLLTIGSWRYRWLMYAFFLLISSTTYLSCFVAGMALCDWYVNRPQVSLPKRAWVPLLVAGLLLGSVPVGQLAGTPFGIIPGQFGMGMEVPYRVHILGAILLVAVLIRVQALQRLLNGPKLQYLGRVSFGLYLIHLLVIGTLGCWLFTLVEPATGYMAGFLLTVVLSAPVILVAAHGFTKIVDEPTLRWVGTLYHRHFPARWKPKAEPAAQPAP